jgi:hypothetical protein
VERDFGLISHFDNRLICLPNKDLYTSLALSSAYCDTCMSTILTTFDMLLATVRFHSPQSNFSVNSSNANHYFPLKRISKLLANSAHHSGAGTFTSSTITPKPRLPYENHRKTIPSSTIGRAPSTTPLHPPYTSNQYAGQALPAQSGATPCSIGRERQMHRAMACFVARCDVKQNKTRQLQSNSLRLERSTQDRLSGSLIWRRVLDSACEGNGKF